jgi:hypothetical protein
MGERQPGATSSTGDAVQALWSFVLFSPPGSWTDVLGSCFLSVTRVFFAYESAFRAQKSGYL